MLLAHEKRQLQLSDQTVETLAAAYTWLRDAVWDGLVKPLHAGFLRRRLLNELDGMDDRMLADIGLSRADINMFVDRSYRNL